MPGLTTVSLQTTLSGTSLPEYGRDLSCTNDLDPAAIEVTGLQCLVQALYRRIITPRGTLIDDPNYGYDITQFLNDDLTASDLARIGAGVDSEFVKDERVLRSSTTVTLLNAGLLTITCAITPNVGPTFKLVIAASSVSVQILQAAA